MIDADTVARFAGYPKDEPMSMSSKTVRERMRRDWAARSRSYAEQSAANNLLVTQHLLDIVPPRQGDHVLDVATGPGVVAVQAARSVGPAGQVVATDLVPEWEAYVEAACQAAGVANCAFRVMGAEKLDFPPGAFDVAYCQLGLMFVPSPVAALREMRRVLRPDGRLGVVVWSAAERVPYFETSRMMRAVLPSPPEDAGLPTPLSLGQPGLIEALVGEAGFHQIAVERRAVEFVFDSSETRWKQLINMADERLDAIPQLDYDRLHQQVIDFLEGFRAGKQIRIPNEAIFVSAMR